MIFIVLELKYNKIKLSDFNRLIIIIVRMIERGEV